MGIIVLSLISGTDAISIQDTTFESLKEVDVSTTVFEGVETCCTDGIDNDGDGLVDNEDGDCWIREGAVFMEDFSPLVTFNDYIKLLPILKECGMETIEMLPVFEHCNSEDVGWRWAVRDHFQIDPHRGEELDDFLEEAHNLGIKVVTMISVEDSTTPTKKCSLIGTNWYLYDEEGIGGHLYQYQAANPEKNILLKNLDGEYACHPMGWGYVVDCDSEDTISLWLDIYEDIMARGFDGVRIDSPAVNYCHEDEKVYVGCNGYPCPDPVEGEHPNLPLYRALRELKKPEQVFISESPTTLTWKVKWCCTFPYYHPYTDMDEVADVSEDYGFASLLQEHIIPGEISSEELVEWINIQYNKHVLYNRERFRFYRNWNYWYPWWNCEYLDFISNDPRYYSTIALVSTIPGIPKVTHYELIGDLALEKIYYWPVNNDPTERQSHWKKVLNIRNDNNALKYGTIENVWESGDNTYAYLREFEDEKVITVINFLNKEATSTLNLSFLDDGTILYDGLNNETFVVSDPSNFEISIPAYGSRILFLKEGDEPIVYFEKPKENYLYVFDKEIMPSIFGNTIILGKIIIEVDAYDEDGIDRVEFYIDDALKNTDYELPYRWLWNEFAFSRHEVKAIVYDNKGNIAKDKIDTIIFNIGL